MNSDKTLSPVGKKTRLKEIHVKKYHFIIINNIILLKCILCCPNVDHLKIPEIMIIFNHAAVFQ